MHDNDYTIPTRSTKRRRAVATLQAACILMGMVAGTVFVLESIPSTANPTSILIPTALRTEPDADEPTKNEPNEQEGIRECVITLKSGRTITGELIREDSREVVIGIEGIETTFQRRNVALVTMLPPVSERYESLRASIPETDIDARLALVEWLRARKAYTLALEELQSILTIEPNNPHAKLLRTWLAEYDKLSDQSPGKDEPAKQESDQPDANQDSDAATQGDEQREYQIKRNELPTLSEQDLNLMRVYEIDLRNPPRISIADEVMLELMRRNPDAFSPNEDERQSVLELPEVEKLKLLFSLKARDLYPKVRLLENPDSLQRFKDQVHHGRGWLINACASTRCHGGVDAGSFQLINQRPNTDETAFTNLYIIENTVLSNGLSLIDYSAPERSPLLQMAMNQSNSLLPHPEIPRGYPGTGYRAIFRHTRDRKYQQAMDWIRSMYQPRPKYGFDYPPEPSQTLPDPDQTGP